MNMITIRSKYLAIINIFLILSGCAMRQPPGGGPVDKTPPKVVRTFPLSDSLNIPLGLGHIDIVFSERMNQATLAKNLFISPPLNYETDWEGWDAVTLLLSDSLQPERTYVISVATGMEDLHKNKMAESFQFAFSTGSQMDRNKIQGRVFSGDTQYPFRIFAYELSDSLLFDPTKQEPDYISMAGTDGFFELNFMKNGRFRILAVDDMNGNLLLDANSEFFGITSRDAYLTGNNSIVRGLNFRVTSMDTLAPLAQMVRPMNNTYLQLRFSEPVIKPVVTICDSITGDTLPVLKTEPNAEFKNILDIFTARQDSGKTFRLDIPAVSDSAGNTSDSAYTFFFKTSLAVDTTTFRLQAFLPKDSTKNRPPAVRVCLDFSRPVDSLSLVRAFHLLSTDSSEVDGNWISRSVTEACFAPLALLEPDSSYLAILDMSQVRDLWGKALADSQASHYFSIVSSRELGSISGRVTGTDSLGTAVYVQCHPLNKKGNWRTVLADKTGTFRFVNLPEGKYKLRIFVDSDGDKKYSFGRLQPFRFAEPFRVLSDTIKVRKRWESSDVRIPLPDGVQ